MQTHEYKLAELLGPNMLPGEIEQDLNSFAADGWRVVTFDPAKRCALLERKVQKLSTTADVVDNRPSQPNVMDNFSVAAGGSDV